MTLYGHLMTKRAITATAPNGTAISKNVGPKRAVGAIRAMQWPDGTYLVTVHGSLANAISGPNQTPVWNIYPRWAIEIGENDQAVGNWFGASK